MIPSELTFIAVKNAAFELAKGNWAMFSVILSALTDEEINKIPTITDEEKVVAEKYGICDFIIKGDKIIPIYSFGGYIMKGEGIDHNV